MTLIQHAVNAFNVTKFCIFNYSVLYILLLILCGAALLHFLLILLFGLSIKFINPFRLEIIGLGYKNEDVIVKIRSIRFILSVIQMLTCTVLIDGVEVIIRKKENVDDMESLKQPHNLKTTDELKNSILGLAEEKRICLFPKNFCARQVIKWYLLYLRFVSIKFLNVEVTHEESGIKLTTESSNNRIQLTTKDKVTSFRLSVRAFQQGINHVELFDAFRMEVSGLLNMNCGDLSKIEVSLDLVGAVVPVYTLVRAISPLHKQEVTKRNDDEVSEFTEHDYLIHLYSKLVFGSYFVRLIEGVNISCHDLTIREIPLATKDLALCQKYEPKTYIEIYINSINTVWKRMHFDYPGYGLLYSYEDKPYHFINNFTGISLSFNNLITKTVKQVMNVPVMNFTGHSNLAFQSMEAIRTSGFTHSKIDMICHLSEPIIDLSTDEIITAVMSAFDFLKYQHRIKSRPEYIEKQEILADLKEKSSAIRDKMNLKFQKYWPLFNLKMSVENPTVMIKDNFDEKYSRILVLQHSLLSVSFKTRREFQGDIVQYFTEEKLDAHNTKLKFRDTSTDLERTVFNISNVALSQRYDILPERNLQSSLILSEPRIDLSNIVVLNGMNYMFAQLDAKLTDLFKRFMAHTEEFDCYCVKSCTDPFKEQHRAQMAKEHEKKSVFEIVNEKIPGWIRHVKITSTQFNCVLGSRSILLSRELMKTLDSQSKFDFIDGKLRKIELCAEETNLEFFGSASGSAGSKSIPSSAPSSIGEDDDFGLSDSSSELTYDVALWKFSISFKKLVGKNITETTKEKNKLIDKTFFKIPKWTIDFRPSPNDQDRLLLDCDIDKMEAIYSVITHFLVGSSIHLLRNTVFEAIWNKLHPPKDQLESTTKDESIKILSKKDDQLPTKPSTVKRILSSIELGLNINFLDLTLVMPSKLKSRFEITNINAFGMMNNPVLLNSDFTRICIESPTAPGYWARFATATDGSTSVDIPKILEKGPGTWIDFSSNVCHITMPNKLMMYQIFNNISLLVKTVKQLRHAMKYNTNEIILYPSVKPGTKLPRMNLKSNRIVLSLEDDPFEAEMNAIFQMGLLEQRSRLEKMRLFDKELSDRLTKSKANTTKSQTFSSQSGVTASSKSERKECKITSPDFNKFNKKLKNINHDLTQTFQGEKTPKHTQSLSNIPAPTNREFKTEFQNAFEIRNNAQEKLQKLRENFSESWIRRVKNFRAKAVNELKESFDFLWGAAYNLDRMEGFDRKVLDFTSDPHLFTLIFEGVDLDVGPPSFGIEQIPEFIHDVGKGAPKDTGYSTLVPMMLDLRLTELRLHLRDYPLPMIHMPTITKNQPSGLPAVRIHGDLIIAEEMVRSNHEIRETFVRLSPGCSEFDEDNIYSIEVPKTVTPIKFFTSLNVDLNSESVTKITWGNSFQPCISQIMASLDNFTKPPIDPSVKLGFWDKIRANFHARLRFNFNDNGAFHIVFKGSKSPYAIAGTSSGFILGFKNHVVLTCNDNDDAKEFITANSQEIMFSVPNHFSDPFLVWCRPTRQSVFLTDPTANFQRSMFGYYLGYREIADPIKVQQMRNSHIQKDVIRLRGGTQLNFSVLFERKCADGYNRTTDSRPHYDIVLCNPKYVEDFDKYDAYRGFRSDFIHLEFQLVSTQSEAYNTIQLSPFALDFFFKWWKMFSNSLPARQGKLFGPERHSQKFSHYLSTLKYQAIIQPLFITHIHHDREVVVDDHNRIECLGLKGRASRLVLDLHQRKELVFDHNETLNITRKSMKNKFNVGMVEIVDFDVRAMKGMFKASSAVNSYNEDVSTEKIDFKTYDNDVNWLDITDFVEIGVGKLHDFKAKIQAHALMKTPSFIYIKKNSYGDKYQVDIETGESIKPFGHESFHDCLYDLSRSSVETIIRSFDARIAELETKVAENQAKMAAFQDHHTSLAEKQVLQQLKNDTSQILEALVFVKELSTAYSSKNPCKVIKESDFDFVIDRSIEDTSFTNTFIVHNMLLKWNDKTRDIFYRYIFLIERLSNVNAFVHHKSLSQIDEAISAQQQKASSHFGLDLTRTATTATGHTAEREQTRFSEGTSDSRASERLKNFKEELRELAVDFFYKTHDNYKIKLVSPQIQLQSGENKNSAIVVTSPAIEMNIIAFDSSESEESDPNIFEQRFGIAFSDASIFMFYKNEVFNTGKLFFSSTSYGSTTSWPPWLGIELCYDSRLIEDHVILHKTTFVARYDKIVNTSYLGSQRDQANKFSVDLSQAVFLCDSKQYLSLYTIVLNLFIYNDAKNTRIKEREAKLLLKLDNKDLATVKDRIIDLQRAVRETIVIMDSLNSRKPVLDDVERADLYLVNDAIFEALTELYLLMRVSLLGSTAAREKSENYMEWNIRADDIKLHMLDDSRHPFLDVILFNSHFKRMEKSDRSNNNVINIENIEILNLDQSSNLPVLFSALATLKKKPKIIREGQVEPLIQVSWQMENPVGGIRIMKKFDVNVLPIQISIEEATGNKLMEYAFPNASPLFSNYDSDDLDGDDHFDGDTDEDFDFSDQLGSQESLNRHASNTRKLRRSASHGVDLQNGFGSATGLTPIEEQTVQILDKVDTSKNMNGLKLNLEKDKVKQNGQTRHKRAFSVGSLSRSGSVREREANGDASSKKSNSKPWTNSAKSPTLDEGEDDEGVGLMLERASNYLSIVAFELNSSQISITFRGTGAMRLINVSDFVIHLPEITMFNKTCTLLDITNNLKKQVVKALLAHSGSLIGNKLSKRDAQKHLKNISGYSSARIHTFRGDKFGKTISNYNNNYIEEYKKKGKTEEFK